MAKQHAGKYIISRGLLWKDDANHPNNIVDTHTATAIACANGYELRLKDLIDEYRDGTELEINNFLKIIEVKNSENDQS